MLFDISFFLKEVIGGRPSEGRLLLYNIHTDERLVVTYRSRYGRYDRTALNALNRFLRCHYTNRIVNIDIRVIEFLNAVDKILGGDHEIHIVSGYRSPEYNQRLIRQGKDVAKNSLHISGKAIDLYIPGIDLDALRKTACNIGYGGVGYYPRPGFIHLDCGRFRTW